MRYVLLPDLETELNKINTSIGVAKNIGRTNVASGNYQLILSTRAILKKAHIEKLKLMNIRQVCINDPLTDDILIEEMLEDDIIETFEHHCNTIRNSLFPIYLELKEQQYDSQTFNLKYRVKAHGHICTSSAFNHLNRVIRDIYETFEFSFKRQPVHGFAKNITKELFLSHHALYTAAIGARLATENGFSSEKSRNIFIGILLQDIGVDPAYYTKEKTTHEDERTFKHHPRLSCMIVNETPFLNPLMGIAILNHHKYANKSGFPKSLGVKRMYNYERGIHENGKIASIANALAANSLFFPEHKVIDAISSVFTGFLFDEPLAEKLLTAVCAYPVGTTLTLKSGEKCIVKNSVENNKIIVRLIETADGKRLAQKMDKPIFLSQDTIKGRWHQDENLKEKTLNHYPQIFTSFLKYQ